MPEGDPDEADGDPPVTDVPDESRFVLRQGHAVAELVYELEGARLALIHTGVPEELAGRGIGGRLVEAALDRARRDGLTVVPVCPFARRWLHHHAQAAAGVDIDWRGVPGP